jgi:S-adenosylmethionine uptake transporter
MFATAGAAILLRERVRIHLWLAVAAGFAGVLVILQPGREAATFGGVLVIVSSLLWSGSMLLGKLATRHDSTLGIVALMATFSALFSLVPALLVWQTPTPVQLGLLLAIAALGTLGHLFFTQAMREADGTVVFPLDFLRLLWAVMFGYLLFGELLDWAGWVGAILIAASAAYIAFREAARQKAGLREADRDKRG